MKQDLINHMSLELQDYEAKCGQQSKQIDELRSILDSASDFEAKYNKLIIDYESVKFKCQKYKKELKCFDEKFFDEIEDLKYNYNQAVQLNKHYEEVLLRLHSNKGGLSLNNTSNVKSKKKNKVKFNFEDDKNRSDDCSDDELKYLIKLKEHYDKNSTTSKDENYDSDRKVEFSDSEYFDQDENMDSDELNLSAGGKKSFDFDKFIGIDDLISDERFLCK